MSERERNLGPNDPTSELGGGDETMPVKNRPATGAGQLHAPKLMPRDWQGGAAATDFLGLDSDSQGDFVLADDAPLAFTQTSGPVRPGAPVAADASNYAQPGPAQPQSEYAQPNSFGAARPQSNAFGGTAPSPIAPSPANPLDDGATSESWLMSLENGADTVATTEGNDDPKPDAKSNRKGKSNTTGGGSKRKLVAALAFVLLAALGGGGWYWKTHHTNFGRWFGTRTEVAQVPPQNGSQNDATKPTNGKPTRNTKKPTKGNANTVATNPAPNTDPHTPNTTDPANTATDPNAAATTDPASAAGDEASSTEHETVVDIPLEPRTEPITPTIRFPDQPRNGVPDTSTSLTNAIEGLKTRPAPVVPVETLPASDRKMPGAVRRATAEDMAGLWRETKLPGQEQIEGDRVLRTVNAGRVRALIQGGEYFEGNLYAVGQKRVWIELELGRISFESPTVRELVQLPPLPVVAAGAKKGKPDLSALPHVEVHLPGGVVTGRLVGRDGKLVTLVTDEGLRAVFESEDVRPLTPRNTRVIGTLSKLEAAKSGS